MSKRQRSISSCNARARVASTRRLVNAIIAWSRQLSRDAVHSGLHPSRVSGGTMHLTQDAYSVGAMAVHSRLPSATFGRSVGSRAYITRSRRSSW